MKKVLYLVVATFLLWSCGGGGDSPDPTPTPVNNAPSKPILSSPVDGKFCIDNSVIFSWGASTDSDGDSVSYLLEIATNNSFSQGLKSFNTNSTNRTVSLDEGVAYYWRVRAKDSKDENSDYSSTFDFYTEGIGVTNYLPFSPSLVSPELNTIISTTTATLEWDSSDVDNDPLTYTIYLDNVNPPVSTVSTDHTGKTLETETLEASTTYYWKVEVSDDHGGTTIGQVWSFTTD